VKEDEVIQQIKNDGATVERTMQDIEEIKQ
jgi:hypothetical protein